MVGTQKTIAMFGSAAALAFAVGFAGVGVSPLGSTTAPTPHPTASVAPKPAKAPIHPQRLSHPPDERLSH
jgi:hypothetical protein